MSRVQLALNVSDIDAAVAHYTTLFDTEPAKRKPGYANFAIADPPLKLVLFENPDEAATLNHLGTEMEDSAAVTEAARRVDAAGIDADVNAEECCFALQDKAWTVDPDGLRWELYTVLADVDAESAEGTDGDGLCCTPDTTEVCGPAPAEA